MADSLSAKNLIAKLVYTKDFKTLDEYRINIDSFEKGRCKQAMRIIHDHRTKYKKMIEPASLYRKLKALTLTKPADLPDQPLSWFCDEFHKDMLHCGFSDILTKTRGEIENADEQLSALQDFIKETTALVSQYSISEGLNFHDGLDTRSLLLDEDDGLNGINTGFAGIDFLTGGIKPTDLWTILGYTNVGKSMAIIQMAVHMMKEGYYPVIITKEMSPRQLMRRVDAFYSDISLSNMLKRNLSDKEKEAYANKLKEAHALSLKLRIEESNGGVGGIAGILDKEKPDILFVDGPYLMAEDSRKDQGNWERIDKVWIDMKNLCLAYKIPNINTMQLTENKASLDKVALAKGLSRHCDSIWGMEQTEDMKNAREIKFRSLKQRDAENIGEFVMGWDFREMDFGLRLCSIPGFKEYELSLKSVKISKKVEEHQSTKPKKLLSKLKAKV